MLRVVIQTFTHTVIPFGSDDYVYLSLYLTCLFLTNAVYNLAFCGIRSGSTIFGQPAEYLRSVREVLCKNRTS